LEIAGELGIGSGNRIKRVVDMRRTLAGKSTPPAPASTATSSSCTSRMPSAIADRSILAQIEEAASRCNAGIFLFTKDDGLIDKGRATR
jgi:hypothetical protein